MLVRCEGGVSTSSERMQSGQQEDDVTGRLRRRAEPEITDHSLLERAHTHTHTQRERHTHTHTHTHRERDTHTHTHTETHRHIHNLYFGGNESFESTNKNIIMN